MAKVEVPTSWSEDKGLAHRMRHHLPWHGTQCVSPRASRQENIVCHQIDSRGCTRRPSVSATSRRTDHETVWTFRQGWLVLRSWVRNDLRRFEEPEVDATPNERGVTPRTPRVLMGDGIMLPGRRMGSRDKEFSGALLLPQAAISCSPLIGMTAQAKHAAVLPTQSGWRYQSAEKLSNPALYWRNLAS